MEIGSNERYPGNALSNFAPHHFELDDVPIASMEGFVQSLKFENPDTQLRVCQRVGLNAKRKGQKKRWWKTQTLYWRGVAYPRKSQAYQDLLDRAYFALVSQNRKFQRALLAKPTAVFTHSIGNNKQSHTVLTKSEFIGELNRCRRLLNDGTVTKL